MKNYFKLALLTVILITCSCSASRIMTLHSSKMEKIELGMSKSELTQLLGNSYTIAKKEMKNKDTIEVISYRNFPYDDEFYLFEFNNGSLKKWDRQYIYNVKETDK